MNDAGRELRVAQSRACHSGEKVANGQNAARDGSPVTHASSATGGFRPATWETIASASAGPSMRIASGAKSSRARSNDRAEPGPW